LPILAPECIDKYDTERCGGGSDSETTPSEDEGMDHHDRIEEEESHTGMASAVDDSKHEDSYATPDRFPFVKKTTE